MKHQNIFKRLFLTVLLVLGCMPAFAALPDPPAGFGVGTTNGATTLSWVIVPARSANNSAAAVTYINATSDKASSVVQFYRVTAQTQATYTNATVTLPVTGTNQGVNWNSGTCIIRHMVDDSYEKRSLTTGTGSTNIVLTAAPLGTVVPGDIIYFATTTAAAKIPVGAATLALSAASPIYVGQVGKPLLMELDSTTTGTLNAAGGTYIK
jgi:hypothetical protein